MSTNCKYCQGDDNGYFILNATSKYSGLEFALSRRGTLRVRQLNARNSFDAQDIINITHCPMCGRKLKEE